MDVSLFISHSYSVYKFPSITVITVIWDESFGRLLFLVLSFPRPHSLPFILMVLYTECYCPRGWCLCNLTAVLLVFMLSFSSAIARAIFYMLDYVASVIKSTQKLLLLYILWCVIHWIPSYNSFSIVYHSIQNHPAYASRVVLFATWDGWEATTQFSLLCDSDK